MRRALARDPGLEVDSVVRKGKNAEGLDTFFVQAGPGRASPLANGFPTRREDLYSYDALVIANVEADFFTRAQLAMAADFVRARRQLSVLGGRSFASAASQARRSKRCCRWRSTIAWRAGTDVARVGRRRTTR